MRPLLSGRKWMFWAIVPIFSVILAMASMDVKPDARWVIGAVDLAFIFLALGLWDPYRFRWSYRALCGMIFVLYFAYLVDSIVKKERLLDPAHAMIVIAYPALRFALTGRFSWTNKEDDDWMLLLFSARDTRLIENAFESARDAGLQIPKLIARRAMIAAHTVAAMKQGSPLGLSKELAEWAVTHRDLWSLELSQRALEALDRIDYASELKQEWQSKGKEKQWRAKIDMLRRQLM